MYPCEFDQNPPIGSLIRAQTTGYANDDLDYFFKSKLNAVTNKKFLVQTTSVIYAVKSVI